MLMGISQPAVLSPFLPSKRLIKKALLPFVFLMGGHPAFSQKADSTKNISHFSGAVTVTNNGISLIPTFSLGKPATIFNLSIGKGKLSFEPDIRFALEGKPWSFLFWWRYKLWTTDKFMINIGAHPALNFRTLRLLVNGDSTEVTVTRRFLAGELSPNYLLSKKVSIGMYYLYSRGIDKGVAKHTHFITLNSNISNIGFPCKFYMKVTPQFYYLKQDKQNGFYFTSTLTLAKRNFPLSVSATINKTIQSDITASKIFVWNASLIYSFNKKYVRI
jgi:hypothetical protein